MRALAVRLRGLLGACCKRGGVIGLHGGVGDGVVAAEERLKGTAHLVAVAAGADQDMGGQGGLAGGDLPDVQVVDLGDAGGGSELVADGVGAEAGFIPGKR